MNTVEALKELYKSFGGKLTDTYDDIADGIPVGNYSVIPDCFAALAEIAGGSIELPVVTQADAGDVLTVNAEGAWTNAEPAKELPTVTASDDFSILNVLLGQWEKSEFKIKKVDIDTTTNGTTGGIGTWSALVNDEYNRGTTESTLVCLGVTLRHWDTIDSGVKVKIEPIIDVSNVYNSYVSAFLYKYENGAWTPLTNTAVKLRFYLLQYKTPQN